ncbi:MAG: ATP-dependent helicase, partial [Planctomycetota bacterium]
TLHKLLKKRGAKKAFREKKGFPFSEVYLHYGLKREIRLRKGINIPKSVEKWLETYFDKENKLRRDDLILQFHEFFDLASRIKEHEIRIFDDVIQFVAEHQDQKHRREIFRKKLANGNQSPILNRLLKTKLYPYQKEGVLFAVSAGRCLLGDDMGLGKTIQAMAAAELMAKLYKIEKVLVVSPATLKYQWFSEIQKFTHRSALVLEGGLFKRRELYKKESFYKIMNYELVYRDLEMINQWNPDLIILDEAQRIKNWKTRTAQSVKQLQSTFAIVLTGTPLENKIEELHSIMSFVDMHKLGPLYRFIRQHQILDECNKVIGYKDLHGIREAIGDVFLRRRKEEVLKQLPKRHTKNYFVKMTREQRKYHFEFYETVRRIVGKWRKYGYITETERQILLQKLNLMRMVSNNTYLVDSSLKKGTKIQELKELLYEHV